MLIPTLKSYYYFAISSFILFHFIYHFIMEKLAWHKIVVDRNCREPSPRWGHSAVLIGDEIVCFGGYAGIVH